MGRGQLRHFKLGLLCMMLVGAMLVSGCSGNAAANSSDDPQKDLVGEWVYIEPAIPSGYEQIWVTEMTFFKDGTGKDNWRLQEREWTWSLGSSQDKPVINYAGKSSRKPDYFKIENDRLILSQNPDFSDESVFAREGTPEANAAVKTRADAVASAETEENSEESREACFAVQEDWRVNTAMWSDRWADENVKDYTQNHLIAAEVRKNFPVGASVDEVAAFLKSVGVEPMVDKEGLSVPYSEYPDRLRCPSGGEITVRGDDGDAALFTCSTHGHPED